MTSLAPLTQLGYRIAVMPHRNVGSLTDLEHPDGVELLSVVPPAEAFSRSWPSDAHYVCYFVPGEEAWPRLRKRNTPILQQIRAAGRDVRFSCFTLEVDWKHLLGGEDEIPTTPEIVSGFMDKLIGCGVDWAVRDLSYYYTTMNGIRLVYFLTRDLPVDKGEHLLKHLARQLTAAGIPIDKRCLDWTRIFRLPRVVRCDEKTHGKPIPQAPMDESWPCLGPSNSVGLLDPVAIAGSGVTVAIPPPPVTVTGDMPTDAIAMALVGTDADRPPWWSVVKGHLKGKHAYTTIYEHRALAGAGARDPTIQIYVGEVCVALRKAKERGWDLGAQHAFSLLLPAVLELVPDEDTPDWRVPLWKACQTYWGSELARLQKEKEDEEVKTLVGVSLTDRILAGMRVWDPSPALRAQDAIAAEYMMTKLIVGSLSGNFYIMKADGTYDSVPVREKLVPARIRELGLDPIITLGYKNDKGDWVRTPSGVILDRHCTVVYGIEGHACGPGNWVRGIGSEYPTLVLRLYKRRTDISPKFHQEVDDWLRALGDDDYNRLCAWIGHALAFDEGPIAALALVGAPGAGKKMFAKGLAECIDSEVTAGGNEMGDYQYGLLRSPFLVINEGFKKMRSGYDPADFFRLLTGGDPLEVNQKFRDPIQVRAPIRVVILANNNDVLTSIAGVNRNLSLEDKLALAQRLILIRVSDKAEGHLRLKGGIKHTAGWVGGDSGEGSHYKVAEHFMWLYKNRPQVDFGSRFLMEGNREDGLVGALSTRSGNAPQIIEILVAMVEAACAGRGPEGVVIQRSEDNCPAEARCAGPLPRIWVTAHSIAAWIRREYQTQRDKVPSKDVIKVFRGLVRRGEPEQGRYLVWCQDVLPTGARNAHWFCIDGDVLLKEAHQLGYACGSLEKLCAEADSNKLISLGATS